MKAHERSGSMNAHKQSQSVLQTAVMCLDVGHLGFWPCHMTYSAFIHTTELVPHRSSDQDFLNFGVT